MVHYIYLFRPELLFRLHSYAAGDPMPIPGWIYITAAGMFILSCVAYFRNKGNKSILVCDQKIASSVKAFSK
jgi:hypothetical protein